MFAFRTPQTRALDGTSPCVPTSAPRDAAVNAWIPATRGLVTARRHIGCPGAGNAPITQVIKDHRYSPYAGRRAPPRATSAARRCAVDSRSEADLRRQRTVAEYFADRGSAGNHGPAPPWPEDHRGHHQ